MDDCLLLSQLINAPSTQTDGELATAMVLKSFFEGSGIGTKIDVWNDNRANFTATLRGKSSELPSLIFFSHLDIVPADGKQWLSPPFEADQRNGRVYGRGAVDMKGPMAAAAVAMKQLALTGYKPECDIILACTAGEETDSCGIIKMIESKCSPFSNAAAIIVTEPTDMSVVVAHKGILWLEITAIGQSAHGSAPHLGSNAVHKLCKLVTELQQLDLGTAPHPKLGANTLSVNAIKGGVATNVIPDICRIEVDIRLLPGQRAQSVIARINELIDNLKKQDPKFITQLKVIRDVPAFETDEESSFVQKLCDMLGKKPEPINFTTDAPYLTFLNCPTVIMGPGDPGLCHKPDEFIEIDHYKNAVDTYTNIIRNLM